MVRSRRCFFFSSGGNSEPDEGGSNGDNGSGEDGGFIGDIIDNLGIGLKSLGEAIVKSFQSIIAPIIDFIEGFTDTIKGIIRWAFYVDFEKVKTHINYKEKLEQKFAIFYQFADTFKNINPTSEEHEGKFYMNLPSWLGGQEVCWLDLSLAKPVLDWGKTFLKYALWIGFGIYVVRKFDIKFNIG